MPEGDSVLQLSRRLQFLQGKTVTATSMRVPRYATWRADGSVCERIWPYGKYLFFRFAETIVATHLKMEGTWAIHLAGDRWRKPGHSARMVMRFAHSPRDIEIVGHSLGLIRIFPASEYENFIGDLGPDILDPQWDRDEAVERIISRPHRDIGTALLDQTNLAGIGNEYRAEVCFLAGIHPSSTVGALGAKRVGEIVDIARRIMWANRDAPVRVTTGVKRAGETTYVFGRNHRPCRRCRTLIVQDTLGKGYTHHFEGSDTAPELERIIWWCPHCQPVIGGAQTQHQT